MLLQLCAVLGAGVELPAVQESDAVPLVAERPVDIAGLPGVLVDGAVAISDERIVSLFDLDQTFQALLAARAEPVNSFEDQQRLQREALLRLVIDTLAAQAGRELGIPEEGVESRAQIIEADRIANSGILAYGDDLRRQGVDPLTFRRRTKSDIYRIQWEAYVTGDPNYGGGRPAVDGFIRPGELRAYYEVRLDDLGKPGEIALQVVTFDATAWGSQEYAEEGAAGMLEELAAGASWKECAFNYSSTFRDTDGVRPRQTLTQILDDDLRRFAGASEAGAVSGILPRRDGDGDLIGVQVARVIEKTEGEPPLPFDDPALQKAIRTSIQRSRESVWLGMAEERLILNGYAWTAPGGLQTL